MNTKLLNDKNMREEMIENISVLEKVKDLILLSESEFATSEQIAKYYEVGEEAVKTIMRRHRDEMMSDGVKILTGGETKDFLVSCKMTPTNFRGYFMADDQRFAYRSNTLFPKRAILRVGMLLRDSEVAKEVRTRLLDIAHDTQRDSPETIDNITDEIDKEKQLIMQRVEAEMNGDYDEVSVINAKLFGLKNKRITELENENSQIKTNSLTITEARSVINRITRTIASRSYGGSFSGAWGELYRKVNYMLGINIKSRGKTDGSYLKSLTDDEVYELEKITRSWAVDSGLDLDEVLKIAQ